MQQWLATLFLALAGNDTIWQGVIGGLVITLFNTLGALLILVWHCPSARFQDTALGFAAGVMLTASFTSLILPGIALGGINAMLLGLILGVLVLDLTDHTMPHLHAIMGYEGRATTRLQGVWLFILAVTLHNMPEGLAVGVSFGSGHIPDALKLMVAIGLQNFPEGFAVAAAALQTKTRTSLHASLVGIQAGLVEIPLALLGAWAVQLAAPLLPYAMGLAAGAMLYVISDEIVPETHCKGHERLATFGTMLGVVVMLYLDVTLGG
jgi:ZIP family zinc transporter